MKKMLKYFIVIVVLGVAVLFATKIPALGLGTNDFCAGCHVMEPQYETFMHSAHQLAGNTCVDCHLPHSLGYGAVDKAYTGIKDFAGVVMNKDPFTIHAGEHSKDVVQDNCIRCHGTMMLNVGDTAADGGRRCFDCHRNTPHGTYPNVVPEMEKKTPKMETLTLKAEDKNAFMQAVEKNDKRADKGEEKV